MAGTGMTNGYCGLIIINSFTYRGVDYSEHDERHYIYDHGIEVEGIEGQSNNANAHFDKLSDNLSLWKTSNGSTSAFYTSNTISMTEYTKEISITKGNKINVAGGNEALIINRTKSSGGDATEAIITFTSSNIPKTILDITSVNSSSYPMITTNGGGTSQSIDVKEWWLE